MKNRRRSGASCDSVIPSAAHRKLNRSTPAAPAAAGLAGATIGRPRSETASIWIGHSVTG